MKFDLAIIGGGPAGYTAAVHAARLGAKAVIVEENKLGGTCLHEGCIPTKAMVASSALAEKMERSLSYGIRASVEVDYGMVHERKQKIVGRLFAGLSQWLNKQGICCIRGKGELTGIHELAVRQGDQTVRIEANHILICTGSRPLVPSEFDCGSGNVMTSSDLLRLADLPRSLAIVGGGVVGCEFASIFKALGAEVSIIETAPRLLPMADGQISEALMERFRRRHIQVFVQSRVESIRGADRVEMVLDSGRSVTADAVLVAVGREPNSRGIGLEKLGVRTGPRGEILVNEYMQTNIPNIYAAGDVNGIMNLAHAAYVQGTIAVEHMLGNAVKIFRKDLVPVGIFTSPEIAYLGATEEELRQRGIPYRRMVQMFAGNGKAVCEDETFGWVKLLCHEQSGELLGMHVIGSRATDLIHEGTLIRTWGLPVSDLADAVFVHPSLGEIVKEAAESLKFIRGENAHG